MYLKKSYNKVCKKTQLTIVRGYRENGKVKSKVIKNLGFLEDWLDQYEDPIAHFQEEVRQMNEERKSITTKLEINLQEKLEPDTSNRKNLGYAVPKTVYDKLGLYQFFQYKQRFVNTQYNLNSIFSLLIFDRFLFPSSKKHAYDTRDRYFDKFDFALEDVYRSLDFFESYSVEIQNLLAQKTKELFGRDPSLGYWDVTNYYFEIPYEDEDEVDEQGNITKKGQKKRGPSKEHRKDPIIQMGLLMDSNGIPIAYNTFSGGESEKTNMLPAIRSAKRDLEIDRIIVVADRGLNTSDNTAFLSGKNHDDMVGNDGYIYGQSVVGADKEFREWVLNSEGYVSDEETDKDGNVVIFKHKSRIHAKKIKLKKASGNRDLPYEIYQKQMVYYSEKYAKKQKADRERAIAKAMSLIANPGQYTQSTCYGAAAYVKNLRFIKGTGEIADGSILSLDLERISEEEKYDGYYAIVTSEKKMSDAEIRNKYRGLWEIEESFKIMKSEFKARPVYVKTDEHVNAHFLTCYVALVIMRVIEHLLGEKFTVKQIRESLCNYSCSYLEQGYYLFDQRDEVLDSFGRLFGWDLTQKYMPLNVIKNILSHRKE
ncbi:MAG: IS1634 family transposase [Eubacteriales bacterium]|nr:IS1634 family transposase [Eubacteriales bacterium]